MNEILLFPLFSLNNSDAESSEEKSIGLGRLVFCFVNIRIRDVLRKS